MYWKNAGMTYVSYVNTCAAMVRNCLKEPHKTKAVSREQVYYKLQTNQEGEPQKLGSIFCECSIAWLMALMMLAALYP
ncbi:unnamed protein product [Sphagnum tenellum]